MSDNLLDNDKDKPKAKIYFIKVQIVLTKKKLQFCYNLST